MQYVLAIFGWGGLALAMLNGGFSIFGSPEDVQRYIGGSRSMDINFSMIAFWLIFLGLASILARLISSLRWIRQIRARNDSYSADTIV